MEQRSAESETKYKRNKTKDTKSDGNTKKSANATNSVLPSICSEKVTKSERNRLYYEKNRDKLKEASRNRQKSIDKDSQLSSAGSAKLAKAEINRRYYEKNKDKIKEAHQTRKKQVKENDNCPSSTRPAKLTKAEINKRYYEKNKDKIKEACQTRKKQVKENESVPSSTTSSKLTKGEINKHYYEKNKDKIKAAYIAKYKDPVTHEAALAKRKAAYRDPVKHAEALSKRKAAYRDPVKRAAELSKKKAAYAVQENRTSKLATKRKFCQNPANRGLLLAQRRILYQNQKTEGQKRTKPTNKDKTSDYEYLLSQARKAMLEMPILACTVCHRARFREQVKLCHRNKYPQSELVLKCFTGKYIHLCSADCNDSSVDHEKKKKEWICFTCHRHLLKGNMPPQAAVNNLWLDDIPAEIKSLNALEMHLVSIVQPFMKIVPLPRGGQKGIRGQMVCVPANLQRTADSLPWTLNTNNLIRVKLKRKQQYKGHHLYMVVNQERVMSALRKLMEINPAYKGKSFMCRL